MLVEPDRVLFSGDLIFEGRIPFIGSGDTRHWLRMLERLETGGLRALVPGHGPASFEPAATLRLTRRYLAYLRATLSAGVEELMSFDEIYDSTDWSEFEDLPAFEVGNRINAYQVYLSLEDELLAE
jgi:glyoxylase-like metal-dependent hydrolase (beta-lactamase superfamily II)